MPLSTILHEIGRQANIDIQGSETIVTEQVTIRFSPLPLEKGIRRIMRQINYLTTFNHHGTILRLTICDKTWTPASGTILHLREATNPPTVEPAEALKPDEPENNPEVMEDQKGPDDKAR